MPHNPCLTFPTQRILLSICISENKLLYYFKLKNNWFKSCIGFCSKHISPPSRASLPHPSRSPQSTELSSLGYTARFPLAIYFTDDHVYMLILLSQFVPRSPFLTVPIALFSKSVSLFLPSKYVHLYHFSRVHIFLINQLKLCHSVMANSL